MSLQRQNIPLKVQHLFTPLDKNLIELLESLDHDEWNAPTIAKLWTVKDIASHLLDGNLRVLSIQKDKYFGEQPLKPENYNNLVNWLDQLNSDWIIATKRLSPNVLITLHKATGFLTSQYYESLILKEKAIFPVNWAGENESQNWMHLAREYSEKWLHQQQIRDAVGRPGIMTKEFFYPLIDTFMMALPNTFRNIKTKAGVVVKITVTTELGGKWFLENIGHEWVLLKDTRSILESEVNISPEVAWKLFSKGIRFEEALELVQITGNQKLAYQVLKMVSVMA